MDNVIDNLTDSFVDLTNISRVPSSVMHSDGDLTLNTGSASYKLYNLDQGA